MTVLEKAKLQFVDNDNARCFIRLVQDQLESWKTYLEPAAGRFHAPREWFEIHAADVDEQSDRSFMLSAPNHIALTRDLGSETFTLICDCAVYRLGVAESYSAIATISGDAAGFNSFEIEIY